MPNIPATKKEQLCKWLDSLPETDSWWNAKADEDPITIRIATFSGAVWMELPARRYEVVASVLDRCPQPHQNWPGDRSMLHKFILGSRVLREGELIGDLLEEQGPILDEQEGDMHDQLNLTLCVEALRVPRMRLKNRGIARKPTRAVLAEAECDA